MVNSYNTYIGIPTLYYSDTISNISNISKHVMTRHIYFTKGHYQRSYYYVILE